MAKDKLKVAVTQQPPFVMESDGKYSGFEIELWEAIAKDIGVNFEYEKHNFQELIPSVAEKKADVAFSAITINESREEIIDFSHPIFNSGLKIMLSKNRSKIDLNNTLKAFLTKGFSQLIKPSLVLLLIIFIFGNLFWFAERSSGIIDPSYIPGVFQAIWTSLCIIIGSPDYLFVYAISTWEGRFILTIGQLINLAILGILIGQVTYVFS